MSLKKREYIQEAAAKISVVIDYRWLNSKSAVGELELSPNYSDQLTAMTAVRVSDTYRWHSESLLSMVQL